jgi:hypothetical protein
MDRKRVLSYKINQVSFERLAMYPKEPRKSADYPDVDSMDLPLASIFLGNLEAFRLLNSQLPANDGSLHLTALLALPEFVQLLLRTHDPNFANDTYDFQIPLAVACRAEPSPWCKIANKKSTFRARRRRTMQVLALETNLEWRSSQQQTILHIAIETGVDVTEDMIHALDIQNKPYRVSRFTYHDKGGREFSLQEYITELVRVNEDKKQALLSCLSESGLIQCRSRTPFLE